MGAGSGAAGDGGQGPTSGDGDFGLGFASSPLCSIGLVGFLPSI